MFLPEGLLYNTKENQATIRSAICLQEAINSKQIVEARAILCDNNHNLWVDLPAGKGIIPRLEGAIGIDDGSVKDIALISRVGKPVCFTVQQRTTDPAGDPLWVLSRKEAQQQCRNQHIAGLFPGDVIDVIITHLEPYGAFCDIGCGISSLIPINSISVSRIFHPADRFTPGQHAKAIVKAVEPNGRILLTHKELFGTWEENAALFHAGETVTGLIRTVEPYGCFVELTPNLAGLAEPKEGVCSGQNAAVFIKSIIPEKMKVKLIIVDAFECSKKSVHHPYLLKDRHIDHWHYSPPECDKIIKTDFI